MSDLPKKQNTSRKKTKVVGHQEYINKDTGQIETMQVINIEDRDANFHKIWLGHIISSLDLIGNKKIKILSFIMQNLNADNMFLMTHREMVIKLEEQGFKVSRPTINETMQALQEADFLRKVRPGTYAINPEIIFKGGTTKRMNVLLQYTALETKKDDDSAGTEQSPNLKRIK